MANQNPGGQGTACRTGWRAPSPRGKDEAEKADRVAVALLQEEAADAVHAAGASAQHHGKDFASSGANLPSLK